MSYRQILNLLASHSNSSTMWEIEIRHDELGKYRNIKGKDKRIVEQKANAQMHVWDQMWAKKMAVEERKKERASAQKSKEEKKQLAVLQTNSAQKKHKDIENTLTSALSSDKVFDADDLIDNKNFSVPKPSQPPAPELPEEPQLSDVKYVIKKNLLNVVIPKTARAKRENLTQLYYGDRLKWQEEVEKLQLSHDKLSEQHNLETDKWKVAKKLFETDQHKENKKIQDIKTRYFNNDCSSVEDYFSMVLSSSKYPGNFPIECDLEFLQEPKILVVDYALPDLDCVPKLKTVKYIITRDEFTETNLADKALNKIYDNLIYQICLRTIHEIFKADVCNLIVAIVFNGWVDSVDKSVGQNVNACILTVQTSAEEFSEINLEEVDPKSCFKKLKGIGSSKLHALSPVAPIMSIDRDDNRFVNSYEVIEGVNSDVNLAAMDWQDFENLIREIFEKEFASTGGEVKITQASRDGGVDAIAFDPDPIRGGKIVIQAKRYTNTVGVSAVRDLYGTTMNEGAIKGILVTTADFGPDAYAFAKDKPITLLSGGNLLHLLKRHGHRAKIDLMEAKVVLAEQQKDKLR